MIRFFCRLPRSRQKNPAIRPSRRESEPRYRPPRIVSSRGRDYSYPCASTAHCRLVVAMLLIAGSYERDDRQVQICYHWLSAHYANIHSECQTDTVSRSCLSRFAKAFLRPCIPTSLALSLSLPYVTLARANTHVQRLCHFWTCRVFRPFPIHGTFAKSYPLLRSRHGLSTRFRCERDTRPSGPYRLNAFRTDVSVPRGESSLAIARSGLNNNG